MSRLGMAKDEIVVETLSHPVTGFHVACVHSMRLLSAILLRAPAAAPQGLSL